MQRNWLNARDRFMEEAEQAAYDRDKGLMSVFNTPLRDIKCIDTHESAEQAFSSLLDAIGPRRTSNVFFGFDSEGANMEVIQFYTRIDGVRFAYVCQVNKFARDNRLPPKMDEFLNLRNIVFVGKNVEAEIVALFQKFSFSDDRLGDIMYIDVLTLVQVCDLYSRHDLNDAVQYATDGTFVFAMDVPDEATPTVFENAGIRAVGSYFKDNTIDKRIFHVHPN